MYQQDVLNTDVELDLEEEDPGEQILKRAIRRKNTFYKNKKLLHHAARSDSMCPEEKRIRKRMCNRKARYSDDPLNYGGYKKYCQMAVKN